MVRLRSGKVSITGNFRENNEDRCHEDPSHHFFIVADGMGGQAAGEKASELAVELVPQKLQQAINFESDQSDKVRQVIDEAVAHANGEIMALGEVDPNYHNMGTTIVMLVSAAEKLYVVGVGDSRAYRLRGNTFEQLTTDHSLTQALIDAGTIKPEEAESHRYRNVLYRYLGTKEGGTGTEPNELDPESGDRFLLCSDGVTDGVEDDALAEFLQQHEDPQECAEAVVAAAQQGGSKDNITCMIVDVL